MWIYAKLDDCLLHISPFKRGDAIRHVITSYYNNNNSIKEILLDIFIYAIYLAIVSR